jgi:AAA domain-containing protein
MYHGDWGEKGFLGFQRGYDTALHDWRQLLDLLDKLRDRKGMGTFALCHTKIASQANPLDADFDRFVPNMHRKTWDLTHGWSDMCLFGRFHVEVDTEQSKTKGKGKAKSKGERVLHTTYSPAWDAKHRHGLPDEIEMGADAEESWENFTAALKGE